MKKVFEYTGFYGKKALFLRGVLAVFSLLLASFISEGALRVFWGKIPPFYPTDKNKFSLQSLILPMFKEKLHNDEIWYFGNKGHIANKPAFKRKKPKDEFRIFIAGESAAEILYQKGDDNDNAKIFEGLFEKRFPEKNVNIINCGIGGYQSNVILPTVREISRYKPDLLLVLMGNNHHSNVGFERERLRNPPIFKYLYDRSRFYRHLSDLLIRLRIKVQDYASAYESPDPYEENIDEIGRFLNKKKVPFMLFSLPVNEKDVPPCDYYSPRPHFFIARYFLEKRFYDRAIDFCLSYPQGDSAILSYVMGCALYEIGRYDDSLKAFEQAVYLDRMTRANFEINRINKKVAQKYSGFFVDIARLFRKLNHNKPLGFNFFFDMCHWNHNLGPPIYWEIIKELNKKEISGIAPVPQEELDSSEYLHRASKENIQPFFFDQIGLETAITNFLDGWFVLGVQQMRFLIRNMPDLPELFLAHSKDDENLIFSGHKVKVNPELLKKEWHKLLICCAEASRLEGDLKLGRLFLDKAFELDDQWSESWLIKAFYLAMEGDFSGCAQAFYKSMSIISHEKYDTSKTGSYYCPHLFEDMKNFEQDIFISELLTGQVP